MRDLQPGNLEGVGEARSGAGLRQKGGPTTKLDPGRPACITAVGAARQWAHVILEVATAPPPPCHHARQSLHL